MYIVLYIVLLHAARKATAAAGNGFYMIFSHFLTPSRFHTTAKSSLKVGLPPIRTKVLGSESRSDVALLCLPK